MVELCEKKIPTYFINSADKILSDKDIMHANWQTKEQVNTNNYLPEKKPVKILITSGASCPDAVVEEVISKLVDFFPDKQQSIEDIISTF